jgi:hypothetical protein
VVKHFFMKNPLDNFDYRVQCDDFFLYELGRLIEEDRASLEDEEFRRMIDAGIHEHVERRVETRAGIAARLRKLRPLPARVLHLVEDIEASLRDVPLIIESYTKYLLERLEKCVEERDETSQERVEAAAELLLESPEDPSSAETAIETLGSIQSPASSRVLAYAISEPMLEEDLEMKAYACLRAMWPLPRPYILYSLKPHTHEDIPFRWFQLLVDCNEPSAVDRILEEVVAHANDTNYREDLLALVELLAEARDPETEEKILQVFNSEETPRSAREILEAFLKNTRTRRHKDSNTSDPWAGLDRLYAANKKYLAAANLFDAGRKAEADRKLDDLLKDHPHYPFAVTLKQLI